MLPGSARSLLATGILFVIPSKLHVFSFDLELIDAFSRRHKRLGCYKLMSALRLRWLASQQGPSCGFRPCIHKNRVSLGDCLNQQDP